MTGTCRLLASVRSAGEAHLAWPLADLVDAKEPQQGALGALDTDTLRAIVAAVAGRRPVSATTGDLPLQAAVLGPAMQRVADTGVDYVKVGLFGPPDADRLAACLQALPPLQGARPDQPAPGRIAVLMADQGGLDWPLHLLAQHGFAGVMVDTADKRCGGLRAVTPPTALLHFVHAAHDLGLLCGLAGSLGVADIVPLRQLRPDYLGFRTALCEAGERTGRLSATQLADVAALLHAA